jgi:hypothetical protein
MMANWTFMASRAQAPPRIAHDPEVRVGLWVPPWSLAEPHLPGGR